MVGLLNRVLEHPLTKSMSVDDPRTTLLRREIIRSKPFLVAIYREWYKLLLAGLPDEGPILEVGSGAGFFGEMSSRIITSEVFELPDIDILLDGVNLPFAEAELSGIAMTDVLHHIPDPTIFFTEATRCVRPGGKMVMVEPWHTPWSEWVYKNLHSEPFEPGAGWLIPETGPLSGANGALPWILFARDRAQFETSFPKWSIQSINPIMPFSYLLSGGVSLRSLMPGWSYGFWRKLESWLAPNRWAMFALIELERK
jgi:SAM-dependent methyltransferase